NRDAAQIAALPKSAIWSLLQSRGLVVGSASARSLTSERTEYTSSPATSGGHPKRIPLGRPERACKEVTTMNRHTTHGSAAGVAHTGGSGSGRAVWHDELAGGVSMTRGSAAERGVVAGHALRPGDASHHAGRAVLVTAWCSGTERRGGRPNGVHPSVRTGEAGAKGWTREWRSSLPARPTIKAERRGGIPAWIHPSAAHTRPGTAGWTPTPDV